MRARLATAWRSMVDRAPRRLRITRAGQVLIALALAAGLAAINTGNNLLFLAWGMVLSAMVVSGVLSEAALRPLHVSMEMPDELRANRMGHLRVSLLNTSRLLPALAIEIVATWRDATGALRRAHAPFVLRIDAGASLPLYMPMVPGARGPLHLAGLSVRTAYPFGLFIKERPLRPQPMTVWVLPAAGPAQPHAQAWIGRLGQRPAARAGAGEDYFATRAYRPGDALKHVLWRRVARTGRWLVVEREARAARTVTVVLCPDPSAAKPLQEAALSAAGTLMETLLAQGLDVALVAPGVAVSPGQDTSGGQRQRRRVLEALARLQLDAGAEVPHVAALAQGHVAVALLAPGLRAIPHVPEVLALHTEPSL